MANELDSWQREHFQPGGGDAFVMFDVFGTFEKDLFEVSRKRHRSNGLPKGVRACRISRAQNISHFENSKMGSIGKHLAESGLSDAVNGATEAIFICGEIPDPQTLDFMRDVIGVIESLFECGAVAVLDWQQMRWFDVDEWHTEIFLPKVVDPHRHVAILISEELDDPLFVWLHTRGMRKFGRPDLGIHRVNPAYQEPAIDLLDRFIQLQAMGHIVREGQPIQMAGLPEGMTCHHRGSMDDPDFNNVHVEISWPALGGPKTI